jgi:hypothetical protein
VLLSLCALILIAGGAALGMPRARSATPPSAAAPGGPVSPVPGSSGNEYVTGPFAVTLKGISPLPAQYDAVTEQGQPVLAA